MRTIPASITTATPQTRTTTVLHTTARSSTTVKQIKQSTPFPIGGIVGILVGSFVLIAIIGYVVVRSRRRAQEPLIASDTPNPPERKSLSEILHQYRITTRTNPQATRRSAADITRNSLSAKLEIHQSLVSIEC